LTGDHYVIKIVLANLQLADSEKGTLSDDQKKIFDKFMATPKFEEN